jgi:hypothetical protein
LTRERKSTNSSIRRPPSQVSDSLCSLPVASFRKRGLRLGLHHVVIP